jgi:endonuclease YncB( thermonuclease family)
MAEDTSPPTSLPENRLMTQDLIPTSTASFTPIPTATEDATPTRIPSSTPTPTDDLTFYDLFTCLPKNNALQKGTVTQVIDGDTIVITASDGVTHTIRYIGIDAPETGRPFSEQATEANAQLVQGRPVTLVQDVSETDQYGRWLRYVISGNTLVNLELVRMGWATAASWPPDVACNETFSAEEESARQIGLGRWVDTPTPDDSAPKIVIISVTKREEWVDIQNQGEGEVELTGWILVSERGNQDCALSGVLEAGKTLRVWAMTAQGSGFSCGYTSPIWNNSEADPAVLYNPQGNEVSRK